MSTNSVLGVIPARYGSTRFPGKPLASILGKPMIEWVWQSSSRAQLLDRVLVATDDERILETVEKFGGEAIMTSSNCASGSDRVAEVIERVDCDYVVNIQGDEPLIEGSDLDRGIKRMLDSPEIPVGSFMAECPSDHVQDPDVAKVVVDQHSRALYFSRSPIPFLRDDSTTIFQHIGIYIYQSDYLKTFQSRAQTPLEQSESLEQLRVLEHGNSILMTELPEPTVGVDRPQDIEVVEEKLAEE